MIRRKVVTAVRDGRSKIVADEPFQPTCFQAIPGFEATVAWRTPPSPSLDQASQAQCEPAASVLPGAGGTSLFIVTFPPDSVMTDPAFNLAAAGAEYVRLLPGMAELFEADNPGMHRTPTIDYGVVLEGAITAELDDGVTVDLNMGDILVQQGTRHAWRNRGDIKATLMFVLIGAAERSPA